MERFFIRLIAPALSNAYCRLEKAAKQMPDGQRGTYWCLSSHTNLIGWNKGEQ